MDDEVVDMDLLIEYEHCLLMKVCALSELEWEWIEEWPDV